MKFYSVLGSVFCSAVLAADPLTPIDPTTYSAPVKVACIGDSITQGAGAAPGKSYPAQLQEMLGGSWTVGNFGVSGRTLLKKGDYPYWQEDAFRKALAFAPDVVVIMLGTNDTKPQNWKHKKDFEGDYTDMVKSFSSLDSKPKIYLCMPCPVPPPGNFGINEAGVQEEMKLIGKLAAKLKVGTIDMHAALADKPQLLPDRVHPSTEGATEMAKAAAIALTGKAPVPAAAPEPAQPIPAEPVPAEPETAPKAAAPSATKD